jgi:hypothetical protein
MTVYSDFVKQWASDHGLSYGCAVSTAQIKIDFKKFKAGQPYGEFETNVNARKKSTKANENAQMGAEDKNLAMPRSKINASQLINKLQQIKEMVSMGLEDRNVAMPRSNINARDLINKLKQIKELVSMGSEDKNIEPVMEEVEVNPRKKLTKQARKRESNERFDMMGEDFNMNNFERNFERAKQARERSSMGAEDINVARPKPRININDLINKLEKIREKSKQAKERSSMGSEDRNVAVKKTGSEEKIKKYIEKLNKIKDEIYNINLREDAVMVKINASKNPPDILTKQAKNLRKKYIELNKEVENIVEELKKLK